MGSLHIDLYSTMCASGRVVGKKRRGKEEGGRVVGKGSGKGGRRKGKGKGKGGRVRGE